MDKNLILLSIFGSIILISIIWLVIQLFIIIPKQIDKEIKQIGERQKQTEIKLNEKLVNLCSFFAIPLEYKYHLGDAAGHILYHKDKTGRLLLDDCKIEVLEKYKKEPYVLAHELGHYISIKKYQNNTEEMADQMAKELCYMLLSEQEQKDLAISLNVYFKVDNDLIK